MGLSNFNYDYDCTFDPNDTGTTTYYLYEDPRFPQYPDSPSMYDDEPEPMESRARRWSEVMPPHTALSFAAIWDPVEGMVTFSGETLLDSEELAWKNEIHADIDPSERLTIDQFAALLGSRPPTLGTGMFAYNGEALDDTHSVTDPHMPRNSQFGGVGHQVQLETIAWRRYPPGIDAKSHPASQACTQDGGCHSGISSKASAQTLNGEKNRLRSLTRHLLSAAKTPFDGKALFKSGPASQYIDSRRSSASSDEDRDEGFFEVACLTRTATLSSAPLSAPLLVNLNLRSAFSMTTTSTTNYIDVETPSVCPTGHHHPGESHPAPPAPPPKQSDPANDSYTFAGQASELEAWQDVTPSEAALPLRPGRPSSPYPLGTRRRLRKNRPAPLHPTKSSSPLYTVPGPASPAEVLAREEYNHVQPMYPFSNSFAFGEKTPTGPPPTRPHSKPLPPIPQSPDSAESSPTSTTPPSCYPSPLSPHTPTLKKKRSLAKVKAVVDRLARSVSIAGNKVDDHTWVRVDFTPKVTPLVL